MKITFKTWFNLFILCLVFMTGFIWLATSKPRKIEISSAKTDTAAPEKTLPNIFKKIFAVSSNDQENKPINILVLGRPGRGWPGQDLTDTILLLHLEKEKSALVSLPRDLLVKIPGQERLAKINSLYGLGGIETLKDKTEEIAGLDIDRYLLVDLEVVKETINLIGGLNVFVPEDINDPYFPGRHYSYDPFLLKAGWRFLDGETALKYVRTRYTSPQGDFDRMARQQQILRLLKQKVLALNPLWDFLTYVKIFETLRDHIETDLTLTEMKDLWQAGKKIEADQIASLVIDKKETNLVVGEQIILGDQMASAVRPQAGLENYTEIKEYIAAAIK